MFLENKSLANDMQICFVRLMFTSYSENQQLKYEYRTYVTAFFQWISNSKTALPNQLNINIISRIQFIRRQ